MQIVDIAKERLTELSGKPVEIGTFDQEFRDFLDQIEWLKRREFFTKEKHVITTKLLLEFALYTSRIPPYLTTRARLAVLNILLHAGINLNDTNTLNTPYLLICILLANQTPELTPLVMQALKNGSSLLYYDADHITVRDLLTVETTRTTPFNPRHKVHLRLQARAEDKPSFLVLRSEHPTFSPLPPSDCLTQIHLQHALDITQSSGNHYPFNLYREHARMLTRSEHPTAPLYRHCVAVMQRLNTQFPLGQENRHGSMLFKTHGYNRFLISARAGKSRSTFKQLQDYRQHFSSDKPSPPFTYSIWSQHELIDIIMDDTDRFIRDEQTAQMCALLVYNALGQLFRAGNCEIRQAAVLFELTQQMFSASFGECPLHCIYRVEAFRAGTNKHFFVVVNRSEAETSDPRNPNTWGEDCLVLDQYNNVLCYASELLTHYKHLYRDYPYFAAEYVIDASSDTKICDAHDAINKAFDSLIPQHAAKIGTAATPLANDILRGNLSLLLSVQDLLCPSRSVPAAERPVHPTASLIKAPRAEAKRDDEKDEAGATATLG